MRLPRRSASKRGWHLRTYIRRWLDRLKEVNERPGFIGPLPYVLFVRWLVFIGLLTRTLAERIDWSATALQLRLAVLGIAALAIFESYRTVKFDHGAATRGNAPHWALISTDILLISWASLLTSHAGSAVFVLYALPLLYSAEYLRLFAILITFACCAFCFLIAHYVIRRTLNVFYDPAYMAREALYASAIGAAALFARINRIQRETILKQQHGITALLSLHGKLQQAFDEVAVLTTAAEHINMASAASSIELFLAPDSFNREGRHHSHQTTTHLVTPHVTESIALCRQEVLSSGRTRVLTLSRDSGFILSRLCTVICTPLRGHYKTVGTLSACYTSPTIDRAEAGLLEHLGDQTARVVELRHLQSCLESTVRASASILNFAWELDALVRVVVDEIGFRFVIISLLNADAGTIEPVKTRNVPEGWRKRAACAVNGDDIDAQVLRTQETRVVTGPHTPYNKELYERYQHDTLSRIFVPILDGDTAIGVIEAGCEIALQDTLLTERNIRHLQELLRDRGSLLAIFKTTHLLHKTIAEHAISIIGADSASLHVFQDGNEVLSQGAGRATAGFLKAHPPTPSGLGRQALRDRRPVRCDNPHQLEHERPDLFQEGIKAIVAFPLFLGPSREGVLYVHFWREHTFSEDEIRVEAVFAREMEVAIQNEWLLRGSIEEADKAWTVSTMQAILQKLASAPALGDVLAFVAQSAVHLFDADNSVLYLYDDLATRFETPPTRKGRFRFPDAMGGGVQAESVLWKLIADGVTTFVADVTAHPQFSTPDRADSFVVREGISSCAAIVLRSSYDHRILGMMFLNYRQPHIFSTDDKRFILSIASSVSVAIAAARYGASIDRSLARRSLELRALHEIDQEILRTGGDLSLEHLFSLIVRKAREVTLADSAFVLRVAARGGESDTSIVADQLGVRSTQPPKIDRGLFAHCLSQQRGLLISDVREGPWLSLYSEDPLENAVSLICVPITANGVTEGLIAVSAGRLGAFTEHDLRWLEGIAAQLSVLLHSLTLSERLRGELRFKSALGVVASHIRSVWHDVDVIMRLVTTGITAAEGLGFSRALVFLRDPKTSFLEGRMAVGSLSRTEAELTWQTMTQSGQSEETRDERLAHLLRRVEDFSLAVSSGRLSETPLCHAVRETVLEECPKSAISEAISSGATVVVQRDAPDASRAALNHLGFSVPSSAFACVPIVGRQLSGVVVVDNRYLPNEELDADRLDAVRAFADLAAVSIENAHLRLRGQTQTYQDLSHQLKVPIQKAYSRVQRLEEAMRAIECGHSVRSELLALRGQLGNARRVVKAVALFADLGTRGRILPDLNETPLYELLSLVSTSVQDCNASASDDRQLRFSVDESEWHDHLHRAIKIDMHLVDHALGALLDNATKYSFRDSDVRVVTGLTEDRVLVRVVNSGLALTEDACLHCTERGWRGTDATRVTGEGSGIGLWIANHVMIAHGGSLVAVPTTSSGLTEVRLELPLLSEVPA
jgi:GAF domain-containing protein